jgi:hypothetical protein
MLCIWNLPKRRPLDDDRSKKSVMLAGGRGGKVERRLTLGSVSAARARYPYSDSRSQRYGWAAGRSSASRVPLSSNAATTSCGLYKPEMVVIVDLRMLASYFYFLINHIELS